MSKMFKVTISIQWRECRYTETFQIKTLADCPANAAAQVCDRFRDAYATYVVKVK